MIGFGTLRGVVEKRVLANIRKLAISAVQAFAGLGPAGQQDMHKFQTRAY
jgi:hypothetical protein